MTGASEFDDLVEAARAAIAAADSTEAIRRVATSLTGKKSPLAGASRHLGSLEPEARREAGRQLHEARSTVEALIEERRAESAGEELAREMAESRIDLTEFVAGSITMPPRRGHLHLVSQTLDELEDVFVG